MSFLANNDSKSKLDSKLANFVRGLRGTDKEKEDFIEKLNAKKTEGITFNKDGAPIMFK